MISLRRMFFPLPSILALVALTLWTLGLTGCAGVSEKTPAPVVTAPTPSPPEATTPEPPKPLRRPAFAMLTKMQGDPYFNEVCAGARRAAGELGVGFTCQGPATSDAAEQARLLQKLVRSGISGIAIAADDGLSLSQAGKAAQKKGVSVVSFDSQVNADARTLHVRPAPHSQVTYQLLRLARDVGGDNATIAILAGGPKASDQKKMVRRLLNFLKIPPFSGMRSLNVVYGKDDPEVSYREAFGLIHANPDLQVIVCTTPVALDAAAKAAQNSLRLRNKTAAVGIGASPAIVQAVHQGYIPSVVYWSPRDLGYLTLHALYAVHAGRTTGKTGQTFQAGSLGTYRVEDDGFVIMGRPEIYDWKNIHTLRIPPQKHPSSNMLSRHSPSQ